MLDINFSREQIERDRDREKRQKKALPKFDLDD